MMKLMWSPLSPYVRKVRMTATMKGLDGRFEPVPSDTNAGDPELNKLNPLGKVPCLITDEARRSTTVTSSASISTRSAPRRCCFRRAARRAGAR